MVTQRDAIEVIAGSLQRHADFPSDVSYLLHEADPDGEDANVSLPVVEIQTRNVSDDTPSNTEFHSYITDDSGNERAKAYEKKWDLELDMRVWTAARSDNDVDKIGKRLREILYTYDSHGPANEFTNGDGEAIESIFYFKLADGERDDSLIETPSVRTWRQIARVRGAEYLTTTADEPPITGFDASVSTQ